MANEIKEVLNDRQNTRGSFQMNATITQSMEYYLRKGDSYNRWSLEQKEAAHMILQKLSRAANGDPTHRDTWLDIVGYATLALESIDNDESNSTL